MRTRRFRRCDAICWSRGTYSSPQASESWSQSSSVPPRTAAQSAGSGASPSGGQSLGAQPQAQLVPLDLVGDQRRDQVVEVGGRREQHRHRPLLVVVPAAAPGRRLERRPVVERADALPGEDLRLLAHDDHARRGDLVGQAPDRVEEGAEVELLRAGQGVQARGHRAVRRLQHAQQRLAARAQQRRVRAVVELDLVGDLLRGARAAGCRSAGGLVTRRRGTAISHLVDVKWRS